MQRGGSRVRRPSRGDPVQWVEIEHRGQRWRVASVYVAPVGIAPAGEIAKSAGAELPTPDLVDAIWQAADLRVAPIPMAPNRGDDAAQFQEHAAKVEEQIRGRAFRLLAGTHKDVVRCPNGKLGLYGWHRLDGRIIQDCYTGHAGAWRDYSQGLRLVQRISPATEAAAGAVSGGAAGAMIGGVPGALVGAIVGAVAGAVRR